MGCVKSLFEVIWSTGSKDTGRFVSAGISGFWMFEYRNKYNSQSRILEFKATIIVIYFNLEKIDVNATKIKPHKRKIQSIPNYNRCARDKIPGTWKIRGVINLF